MATLSQKTDEIAALESLKKDLAKFEMKQAKATKADVKVKIAAKIKGIREQIKAGKTKGKDVSAKQLANSLLRSRKKFLEMSKKDFNGVIRQLSKKPEYSFLKGMSRTEVINDINRKAKPVGWRFKGRENYKTPTKEQVRKGRANGTVYYENRPNRSDVSQARQLAKGGSLKGYADSEFAKLGRVWNETGIKPKGYDKAKADWESKGGSTYAKGGEIKVSWDKKAGKPNVVINGEEHGSISSAIEYYTINSKKGNPNAEKNKVILIKLKKLKSGSTYAEGGQILSFSFNTDNVSQKEIVGIVENYTKDWRTSGDISNVNMFVTLPKLKANELAFDLKGEDVYDIEIQESRYAKGGSLKGHGLAIGDEIVNVYRDDIYVLNRGVVYMVDLSSGKRTMTKMSKDDAISTFKDGGEVKEDPQVIRYYFEDDGYEYEKGGSTHNDDPNDLYGAFEKGGEVDINDIQIPVHYTMFEDEMYEYGKGGIISVGDEVTVRGTGKTMEVSNISKNRRGQVEFTGSQGTFLIGDLKKN